MATYKQGQTQLLSAKGLEIFQYIEKVLGRYGQSVERPKPATLFCRVQGGYEMRQMYRYDTEHLRTCGLLRSLRVEIALNRQSGKFDVQLHFDLPDAPTQTIQLE